MPAEKIARYEIVQELGKGAMGVVYKALDPTIGRTLALKTMRLDVHGMEAEEMLKRFRNEARAAGTLNHPNIVTIYDAGEWQGLFYIAMEFIEGITLHQKMKQGRLSTAEIIDITAQACAGLDYAHAKSVIHRDVKPANIMLAGPLIKLMDFGIAKAGGATMTGTGQVLGTPNYMAPEQVRGKHLDGRSDLFSLGVILYEMVTGERPFTGENVTTIVYKIVHENPAAPADLDSTIHPGLSAVVLKALHKAPDMRFQNGAEMAHALELHQTFGEATAAGAALLAQFADPSATTAPAVPASTAATLRAAEAAAAQASAQMAQAKSGPMAAPPPAVRAAGPTGPAMPAGAAAPQAALVAPPTAAPSVQRPAAASRGTAAATPAARRIPKPIPKGGKPGLPASVVATIAVVALLVAAGAYWKLQHRGEPALPPAQQAAAPQSAVPSATPAPPTPAESGAGAEAGEPQPLATANQSPATAAAPEPAPTGELFVTSKPAGALISINGRHDPKWMTPFTFSGLKSGSNRLTVSLDGFSPETRTVVVAGGGRVSSDFQLKASTSSGYLAVSSDPAGAAINIDGRASGQVTPARITLPPGPHTIALQMEGYKSESTLVDIGAGQTLPLSPKLSRLAPLAQSSPASQAPEAPAKPAAAPAAAALPFDPPQNVSGNPFGKMKRMLAGIPDGRGMIEIRTKPKGAGVLVNNRFEVPMNTPFRLPIRPGSYTLTLHLKGHKAAHQKVEVIEGKSTSIEVKLDKEK